MPSYHEINSDEIARVANVIQNIIKEYV